MKKLQILWVGEETPAPNINTPAEVYEAVKTEFENADREKFIVLHLNAKNKITSLEVVSVGILNSSLVHPREVFKGAILANANAIICVHNHPSGDLEPSSNDLALTKRLSDAGKILGVEVLDHLIVGEGYLSMKERNLM